MEYFGREKKRIDTTTVLIHEFLNKRCSCSNLQRFGMDTVKAPVFGTLNIAISNFQT